ncbi:MAG: protein kinase domain-containing protein [Persicimonas sp.]
MAEESPQKFGNYTLHELIARGGMAEIYRATMPGIGGFEKTVAIKKILPHLAENEEFITMLKDEANILVSINHSNIAQVYDLGKIEDTYYISMEFVHGIDLSGVVKGLKRNGETVPIPHAVYIASCMCAGLHAAHTNTDKQGNPLNIVHRDVSPHNVIISYAGDVKLIDFGVAKAAVKESHTQMGVIKGKLLYMAPEQAMAKDLDGRADLFAVGLCLYKMLTHDLPFRGENEFQIYNNILSKEIVPPRQLNPEVPEEVNQIVMTLLQRDPDKRYQDGYSAKQDLERALHNVAPGYTVNRLSRFIEENFSRAGQKEQQDDQDISGPAGVAPQTPSANSVGTGQLTSGNDIPEVELEVDEHGGKTQKRQRVPASSQSGPQTPPPHPTGSDERLRTHTSNESTGSLNVNELAEGARGESKSGPPAVVYFIVAMLVVIGGLVAYGLLGAQDDGDKPPSDDAQASAAKATVNVSLDSEPDDARLYRDEEFLGTTPHELTLRRSDDPIDLVLRKEGYEEVEFQVVPESDLTHELELSAAEDDSDASLDFDEGDFEPDAGDQVDDDERPDDGSAPGGDDEAGQAAGASDSRAGSDEGSSQQASKQASNDEQDKADTKIEQEPKPEPEPEPEPEGPAINDKSGSGQSPPPSEDSNSLFDDDDSEPAADSEKPEKPEKQEKPDDEQDKESEDIIDPGW